MDGRRVRRMVIGALIVGGTFDAAARSGLATLAGAALAMIISAALFVTGQLTTRTSRLLVGTAGVFGLPLLLRASPCVDRPVLAVIAVLLLLGVSHARTSDAGSSFPQLGGRLVIGIGHLFLGPGVLRDDGEAREPGDAVGSPAGTTHTAHRRMAVIRGLGFAAPIVVVVGALLTAADPVFEAWVSPRPLVGHLLLGALGAWLFLGLCRTTVATRPTPQLAVPPTLGTIEVVSILGALTALYCAFVVSQLVTAFGGASQILARGGLTYAQYAHRGFFQLLSASAVTALTLLGLRACTDRSRRSVMVLGETTILLTLGIVVVAVRRLSLYEHAYGYTLLRLGCSVTAIWIGAVFLLLAVAFGRGQRDSGWLAPAILLSAMLLVAGWAAANPAAIAARANAGQAEPTQTFDVHAALSLGPDAVPTLVAHLGEVSPLDRRQIHDALCNRRPPRNSGLRFNRSTQRAQRSIDHLCRRP